jgi:hypothetical protein
MKHYCLANFVCRLSGEPLQIIATKEKPPNLSAPHKMLLSQHGIPEQDAMSVVDEGNVDPRSLRGPLDKNCTAVADPPAET